MRGNIQPKYDLSPLEAHAQFVSPNDFMSVPNFIQAARGENALPTSGSNVISSPEMVWDTEDYPICDTRPILSNRAAFVIAGVGLAITAVIYYGAFMYYFGGNKKP
jgi:hypothetical protein